ncbi:GntR family transcriptional regulator [Streptomyces griseoviridis]|uniref:GntR family transcriptional regulator n=1 Tax=Streptomyces griseoviridis TaxID=45398 RepID=UPI0033FB0F84
MHTHMRQTARPAPGELTQGALRAWLRQQGYQNGDVLPPADLLAAQLGVHGDRVFAVLDCLARQGEVLAFPGRGIVITDPAVSLNGRVRVRTALDSWSNWTVPRTNHLIAIVVTRRIADGTYPAGGRVPSLASIAAEFAVSKGEAWTALAPVRARGLLRRCGAAWRGFEVHPNARSILRSGDQTHLLRQADPGLPPGYERLKDFSNRAPGTRFTPRDRLRYSTAVAAAHRDGAGVLEIARVLRCSRRSVVRSLAAAEAAEQTAALLRSLIRNGTFRLHHVLPPRKHLARLIGATREALDLAVSRLRLDGCLLVLPGFGTVVVDPGSPPTGERIEVHTSEGSRNLWIPPADGLGTSDAIRVALIGGIVNGAYPEGQRLPSLTQLSNDFEVSPRTIRRVLASLRKADIIGAGTIVLPSARDA